MKIDVVMPKMGESLQEGTIIRWLKNVGDKVERDEMILEISTDKVDTEVPSPVTGVITKILAKEQETVEVGKVIAEIETDAENAVIEKTADVPKEIKPEAEQAKRAESIPQFAENTIDVVMPKMGESLQEGTVIRWLKQVGDKVERDEMILEISTDKVDTEVPAPAGGILIEILAQEKETIEVGKVIAKITTGEVTAIHQNAVSEQKAITNTEVQQTTEIPASSGNRFYSPLVRSISATEGITLEELNTIQGTGADGRVNKQDLLSFIEQKKQKFSITPQPPKSVIKPEPSQPVKVVQPITTPVPLGEDKVIIPMDRIRQIIAEHMIYSKHTSAHVTSVAEADVTHIVKFRNSFKDEFQKQEGFKLTYTPFFSKALIDGVKQFPMVNVSVDGKNIILHKRINLSFATALDDGNLIVPVIKNADSLNLNGLARSIFDLSSRARSKKLNPDDIQGGTITLTNVGTFGTLFGTPVINQPQCAIIGVGAIQKRPVVREFNGEYLVVVRDMLYVSITYDHRVIDGMLAGQCLAAITRNLESMNPEKEFGM